MNRQEIITLAESLGLLYPEPKSSSDYNSPAHMRLISRLEKFAQEIYQLGYKDGKFDSNANDNTPVDSW